MLHVECGFKNKVIVININKMKQTVSNNTNRTIEKE